MLLGEIILAVAMFCILFGIPIIYVFDIPRPKIKLGRCDVCGAFNFRHNCVDKAWKILQAPNLMDVTLKQEAEEKKRLEILEKQRQEKELEKQLGVDNYRQLKAVRHVMPEYLRKLDKESKEKERERIQKEERDRWWEDTKLKLRKTGEEYLENHDMEMYHAIGDEIEMIEEMKVMGDEWEEPAQSLLEDYDYMRRYH